MPALALASCVLSIHGAPPRLNHLTPSGVMVGSSEYIALSGSWTRWPPGLWVDHPGIRLEPQALEDQLLATIAPTVPTGPHLLRIYDQQGVSEPRFLLVTTQPNLQEIEPNDDYRHPYQVNQLPAALNGALDKKGDVDSYAVSLAEGETLVAEVDAYTIFSPVDAVLRVVDSEGRQRAFNHDGQTLDPFLTWTAPASGAYVIQIMGFKFPASTDIRFGGGKGYFYRLNLWTQPYLWATFPLGMQRGHPDTVQLLGWNLSARDAPPFFHVASRNLFTRHGRIRLSVPGAVNQVILETGSGPERIEIEPNDHTNTAQPLDIPSAVNGHIDPPGDIDCYRVEVQKGESLELQVITRAPPRTFDSWISIQTRDGQELKRVDDTDRNPDPSTTWPAPESGPYLIAVGNLLHRGGSRHLYRLALQPAVPTYEILLTQNALRLKPGETNRVQLRSRRLHGFAHPVKISLDGLPEDVASEPTQLPAKDGELELEVVAGMHAAPFNGPVHLVAQDQTTRETRWIGASLTSSSVNNGVPQGHPSLLLDQIDHIWLTITPASSKKNDPKPAP